MREKLFLLASVVFLSGSANHALFVTPSITEEAPIASIQGFFAADLQSDGEHAVAPQRRVLVQLAREKEVQQQSKIEPKIGHYTQRTAVTGNRYSVFDIRKAEPEYRFTNINSRPTPNPLPAEALAKAGAPIHPAIDRPEIPIHLREIADEVIKMFPQDCQGKLRHFYVKDINGRALGGASTIILDDDLNENTPQNNQEFRALFVHELGHVIDLGCFAGSPYSGETAYVDGEQMMYADDPSVEFYRISWLASHAQREGTTSADFVSGYASWDMFEDFSESFAYYVLHRSEFAERAQQNTALAAKYAWFQKYLPELSNVTFSHHDWNGQIPWDITKLDYTWIGNAEFVQRY